MSRRRTTRREPDSPSTQARAGHDLALGLRAAYLTMHRRANAVFTQFALTADQFVLLTALAESDGVNQKELGRRTHSDPNTLSEMLGRLERRGHLVRQRHADDGRARTVSLTEVGREVQRRAMEGVAAFCEVLAGLVPAGEADALLCHLHRIADGMSGADPSSSPVERGAKRAPRGGSRQAGA